MSDRVQPFGGQHTRRKLDVVAKYLAAYVTVMKKQDFRLFYVDGFAGSGASTSKADADRSQDPTLFPTADVLDGSPRRALCVEPPFDRYLLVDKSDQNVQSLAMLRSEFPNRQIDVVSGDANDRLSEFCDSIAARRLDRAVVFLDPFGLSVRWETIERLASTKKIDLWYLVPVDGMSRQIKDDGTSYLVPRRSMKSGALLAGARRLSDLRLLLPICSETSMSDLRRSRKRSSFRRCFEITFKMFSLAVSQTPICRLVGAGATISHSCSLVQIQAWQHRELQCGLQITY